MIRITKDIFTALAILVMFVAFSGVVVFLGCEEQEKCRLVGETRCVDNVIDICNASGYWEMSVDCSEVVDVDGSDVNVVCCYDETFEGHMCLMEEECL